MLIPAEKEGPMRTRARLKDSIWFGFAFYLGAAATPAHAVESAIDTSKPYCAKALSSTDADVLKKLASTGSSGSNLWPTRSIPIVLHETLPKDAKDALMSAAKHIETISNVRFYLCDGDAVVSAPKIEGFMVAASFEVVQCSDEKDGGNIAGCTKGLGMRKKAKVELSKTDDKALKLGLKWAVKVPGTNVAATAVHELLHMLGMRHGHQNPAAQDSIAMAPDPKDKLAASNCTFDQLGIAASDGITAQWLTRYDPASVMHYGLGSKGSFCNITIAGCKLKATGTTGSEFISDCNVDKVIDSGDPCANKSSGKDCFKRPTILFQKKDYGSSDFGQRSCASVLDQAWLVSAYPETKALDAFGLKDERKCVPLSGAQVSATRSTR